MAAPKTIDLNADVGEGSSPGVDEALMQVVSSVNIACGGHAGDDDIMLERCELAAQLGVRVGAHPSYPDRENFGRVSMSIRDDRLVWTIVEQVERLRKIGEKAGVTVSYFKPHGALYTDVLKSDAVRGCIFSVAGRTSLPVMLLASPELATRSKLIIREGFIDRAYRRDGTLQPRGEPGALILDPEQASRQALELADRVDSLCVHSDTPGALELARAARRRLEEAGYLIGP
jgi:UPF0271 protein